MKNTGTMAKYIRTLAIILSVLMIAACFAGCGAKSDYGAMDGGSYYTDNKASATEHVAYDDYEYEADDIPQVPDTVFSSPSTSAAMGEKMIYRSYAEIETLKFDQTVKDVYTLMEAYGAFVESSRISGNSYSDSYYGRTGYRTAEFVIRVPKENFESVKTGLSDLGNITSISDSAENITEQYSDTESRLATYRTEETRLLEMLEKAETVEDMLYIEDRLADVRYEIESLTSRIKNWDNSINYSTVTLYISEVRQLTDVDVADRTYWEQVSDGFSRTLKSVGKFFTDLFKGLVTALPVLVIIAVIAVVVILIVRGHKKRAKKRASTTAETDQNR